jgi:hypothetical protein
MAAHNPNPKLTLYIYDETLHDKAYKKQVQLSADKSSYIYTDIITPFRYIKKDMFYDDYIKGIRGTACLGNVSESYVRNCISKNNFLMAIGDGEITVQPSRGPNYSTIISKGFVIGKIDAGRRDFYIDVICSSGYTDYLLKYVIHIAQEKGCRSVSLSSLPSVLAYYPKSDFKFRTSCAEGERVDGAAFMAHVQALKRRGELEYPTTSDQAYTIKAYVDFMKSLHEVGLNKKTAGVCNNGAAITNQEIVAGHCGEDGYSMVKCFAGGAGGSRYKKTNRRRRTNRRRTNRRRRA